MRKTTHFFVLLASSSLILLQGNSSEHTFCSSVQDIPAISQDEANMIYVKDRDCIKGNKTFNTCKETNHFSVKDDIRQDVIRNEKPTIATKTFSGSSVGHDNAMLKKSRTLQYIRRQDLWHSNYRCRHDQCELQSNAVHQNEDIQERRQKSDKRANRQTRLVRRTDRKNRTTRETRQGTRESRLAVQETPSGRHVRQLNRNKRYIGRVIKRQTGQQNIKRHRQDNHARLDTSTKRRIIQTRRHAKQSRVTNRIKTKDDNRRHTRQLTREVRLADRRTATSRDTRHIDERTSRAVDEQIRRRMNIHKQSTRQSTRVRDQYQIKKNNIIEMVNIATEGEGQPNRRQTKRPSKDDSQIKQHLILGERQDRQTDRLKREVNKHDRRTNRQKTNVKRQDIQCNTLNTRNTRQSKTIRHLNRKINIYQGRLQSKRLSTATAITVRQNTGKSTLNTRQNTLHTKQNNLDTRKNKFHARQNTLNNKRNTLHITQNTLNIRQNTVHTRQNTRQNTLHFRQNNLRTRQSSFNTRQNILNTGQNTLRTRQNSRRNTFSTRQNTRQNTLSTGQNTRKNTLSTRQNTRQNTSLNRQNTRQNNLHTRQNARQNNLHTRQNASQNNLHTRQNTRQNNLHNRQNTRQNNLHTRQNAKQTSLHNRQNTRQHNLHTIQNTRQNNLHTRRNTKQNSLHNRLNTRQYNLRNRQDTLNTRQDTLNTRQNTLHYRMNSLHYRQNTFHTRQNTLHIKQNTLHNKPNTLNTGKNGKIERQEELMPTPIRQIDRCFGQTEKVNVGQQRNVRTYNNRRYLQPTFRKNNMSNIIFSPAIVLSKNTHWLTNDTLYNSYFPSKGKLLETYEDTVDKINKWTWWKMTDIDINKQVRLQKKSLSLMNTNNILFLLPLPYCFLKFEKKREMIPRSNS
ncbi:unnamed protein product [Mytilus coruscus]|uniref:Uncharacterized protein n=1 Tax=Mytilus coruscus TaxID=42192 RepID=A0A6J8DP03_MYTCO|nr:unnamed protein product [Mytilus coruscus]